MLTYNEESKQPKKTNYYILVSNNTLVCFLVYGELMT